MPGTLHRLMARLFHGHQGPHPHLARPTPAPESPRLRGIPDGWMEKLPPIEDRPGMCHDALDPVSRHVVETSDAHTSGPASGPH